jgi:hypothetical protein
MRRVRDRERKWRRRRLFAGEFKRGLERLKRKLDRWRQSDSGSIDSS